MLRRLIRVVPKRSYCSVSQIPALPKYPPILDLSKEAQSKRDRERYRNRVNSLDTVEEKLFFLNLQHYYGTNCYLLKEGDIPINFLPFVKYITRTYPLEVDDKLFFKLLKFNDNEAKELVERIRPYLQDALLFELLRPRKENPGDVQRVNSLIERINDVLLSSLSMQYQHLLDSTVDYSPRVEAFWLAGNFHPSVEVYQERYEKIRELEKQNKSPINLVPVKIDINREEAVEHHIQYISRPLVQLRSRLPLPQLDTNLLPSYSDSDFLSFLSDDYYCPSLQYGLEKSRRHGTNLPGCWPGDDCEFGLISYHPMANIDNLATCVDETEKKSRIVSQAILDGFSWVHSQAAFKGFSTYSELTYPFTSQQVITDGRRFSFNLFQLNTMLIHKHLITPNTRTNICVTLPMQTLYQEIKGNQFIGWNDAVLVNLLAMYLNKPEERKDAEMSPYLNPAISHVADIEENERRIWLHKQFRYMYSNRPRHRLGYEIFDWERIYKITNNTRPMDAKSRPFERDQNPTEERKYWDNLQPYIPRKFRVKKKHWNGWRAKFEKSYYPDPK